MLLAVSRARINVLFILGQMLASVRDILSTIYLSELRAGFPHFQMMFQGTRGPCLYPSLKGYLPADSRKVSHLFAPLAPNWPSLMRLIVKRRYISHKWSKYAMKIATNGTDSPFVQSKLLAFPTQIWDKTHNDPFGHV